MLNLQLTQTALSHVGLTPLHVHPIRSIEDCPGTAYACQLAFQSWHSLNRSTEGSLGTAYAFRLAFLSWPNIPNTTAQYRKAQVDKGSIGWEA